MSRLRRIGIVASFDFSESVRSRKAIALLVLYVAGACVGTSVFIRALSVVEVAVSERLGGAGRSSMLTEGFLRSPELERLLTRLVGDAELASALITLPPIALFYGSLSLFFVPLLAVLFSCDALSTEIASGAARFSLLRTDRVAWALGKAVSQALLMATGLFASALVVAVLGALFLESFEPLPTIAALASLGLSAWFLGLPYLAIGIAMSGIASSVGGSRALALLALVAVAVLGRVFESESLVDAAAPVAALLEHMVPRAYTLELWRPSVIQRLPSLLALTSLALAYFALGYLRLARRDL